MAGEHKRLMCSVDTEEPLGLGPYRSWQGREAERLYSKYMNKRAFDWRCQDFLFQLVK